MQWRDVMRLGGRDQRGIEDGDQRRRGQSNDCRGEECWVDVTPSSCQANEECGPGCYCTDEGTCTETDYCDDAGQCSDGFECDNRDTCVPSDEPDPDPIVTCQSEVFCDLIAPICPVGSTAGILGGCYTGECLKGSSGIDLAATSVPD